MHLYIECVRKHGERSCETQRVYGLAEDDINSASQYAVEVWSASGTCNLISLRVLEEAFGDV